MPKKKKKKKKESSENGKSLNTKSKETKIVLGLILILLGFAGVVAPFFDAVLLEYIKNTVGYASVLWGIVLIFLAIRIIWKPTFTSSNQVLSGLILLAITSNVFFSFWIPEGYDYSVEQIGGGALGASMHFKLLEILSKPIEFILLIILYIVGLSLITGVKLEQITDAILNFFGGYYREKDDNSELTIEGYDEDDNEDNEIEYSEDESPTTQIEKENNEIEEKKYIESSTLQNEKKSGNTTTDKINKKPNFSNWKYPHLQLLQQPVKQKQDRKIHERNASIIEKTLESFNVHSKVTSIAIGPTVVQYALSITVGTKVAKVKTLTNDLALALAAPACAVRIEAPIPGTSLIGIEIPNPTPNFVFVKEIVAELLSSEKNYELPLILGKNVAGKIEIRDLAEQPHLLVAGATGTGKSVGVNSILLGLLMTKSPDELKLVLVDPKMVEMSLYNDIPHLYTPVIIDMELVSNALQWATQEMNRRYRILKQCKVKKITEYHEKEGNTAMPYIVIVIDEMADLMLTAGADVESKIVRLAQMSRAVGMHLILATQRPSVNVITGLIKANVPGRMAFSVTTSIDSRVIIDQMGAETLIGKGDMLYKSPASPRPVRIQGAFTDTKDIEEVINFIKDQVGDDVEYRDDIIKPVENQEGSNVNGTPGNFSKDQFFKDALNIVVNAQKGSASLLQRKLRIGYNRAASLIDDLERAKVLGPPEGSSPRKVLITNPDQLLGEEKENEEI